MKSICRLTLVIMDHIPLPYNCPFHHMQVPYLDSTPDDDGDWHTYPERHGWQLHQNRGKTVILRGSEKPQAPETAILVQSWLYFAFLREMLGYTIGTHQLMRKDVDGKQMLSTEGLEAVLHEWTTRFAEENDALAAMPKLQNLYKVLIDHRTICLRMYTSGSDLTEAPTMLAIAALSERLMAAVIDVYAHFRLETPVEQAWRLRTRDLPDLGETILALMRGRGWCPYDLRRLEVETQEVSVLYYYSNLKAPRSTFDHCACSGDRCLAMYTNPSTYRLSHRHEGCKCPLLYADQTKVGEILRHGSIPLITVTREIETEVPKINVQKFDNSQEFVAISHVWAEGAGNVNDNALQSCLLENISRLVQGLPFDDKHDEIPFWIDTLCVPVRPPELQTLALNQMRVPYQQAKYVLVLDSHLRSLNSELLTPVEMFAQVSCSSWMRRLWTLQEGKLTKSVWFQFADKAVDVKSIFTTVDLRRIPSSINRWMCVDLYVKLGMHIWFRGDQTPNTSSVASSISSTSHALASRSVSVPTDEGLCLFTLMNKDLTQVTAVSPAQRMEVFWRTFEKVPRSFLFSRVSDKILAKGLHWAPSSFMGFLPEKEWLGPQELNSPKESDPHAIPTSDGLQAAFSGFFFHQALVELMTQFDFTWNVDMIVQDQDDVWYAMRLEEPWRQGSGISCPSQQLAVVLAHELKGFGPGSNRQTSDQFSFQDHSVGVLAAMNRTEDGVIYATAHNHVALELLGTGTQDYLSIAIMCAQSVGVEHSVLSSESHTESKKRYETAAKKMLDVKDIADLLASQARHLGGSDAYENLLDDLQDMAVVAARFGDRAKVQKVPASQQWCVD